MVPVGASPSPVAASVVLFVLASRSFRKLRVAVGDALLLALSKRLLVGWVLDVHLVLECLLELLGDVLGMDEVAVPASLALALVVLPALGLSEVSYGTVLDSYLAVVIIFSIFGAVAGFGLLLGGVLDVDVPQHVLADVVRHHDVQNLSEPAEFDEDFLVEIFEVASGLK